MVSQIELEQSISLQKLLSDETFASSPEELRKNVIEKLKEIVTTWIKRVAYQRRLPQDQIRAASATILTYESYGLGDPVVEPDIEALCVGPSFASMAEDFFIVLHNMLAGRTEVSGILCVKDKKDHLIRFMFDGILIDLSYVKLPVATVPENVDILDPLFVDNADETSQKILFGVQSINSIRELVPDLEMFEELLRCVRLWAKRRGVYGNLFGFFGGVHLAVLAAFICRNNPSGSLVGLVSVFFKTFAMWPWPKPVLVQGETETAPPETWPLMPIQLPTSPHEYCRSNVTTSTFNKIRAEFRRGYRYTQDPFKPQFDWRNLFEPFPYPKNYSRFVKICLSTPDRDELGNWVGFVKSRVHNLLVKLEDSQALCDPNPTEYIDTNIQDPNVVFYWGLVPGRRDRLDLNSTQDEFTKHLGGGSGRLTLLLVHASQLPKTLQLAQSSAVFDRPKTVPVYSAHQPGYVIGYLAAPGGDTASQG